MSSNDFRSGTAGSNTPPVPRPARMVSTIPQNNPGKVSDFEAQRDRKWTEDERMKMDESVLLTCKYGRSYKSKQSCVDFYSLKFSMISMPRVNRPSSAVEVFIPELECVEDETKDEYRFLCPHAGQFMCKVTKLMFEMEGEGEVLYRIVSWDSCPLDGLGQKEPAGPLYSINCYEDSIRKLHLPHCETRKDDVKLTVAHVTGGNVEIIQPLKVTDTHVIIAVQGFSLFGLLRDLIFKDYPIEAQVLVFDMNLKGKHRKSKLHMHLLPGNVPIDEVKKQECNTDIATSATCDLTPGIEYRPFSKNTHHKITIQPEVKKFKSNYGPNYHPTFEVFFNTDVDEVTLGLLDENKKEVWSRLVLLTDTEAASSKSDTTGADFMKKHRETLIQRVPSVMEIADRLISKNMISDEMYSKMNVPSLTSQQQMRILYSVIKGDKKAAKEVYEFLKEKMPGLVDDLESGSSSA